MIYRNFADGFCLEATTHCLVHSPMGVASDRMALGTSGMLPRLRSEEEDPLRINVELGTEQNTYGSRRVGTCLRLGLIKVWLR
jgi:hypothetical protein